MRGESYEKFVEKFKPKKTTDDCMTPELVFDAVRDWAVAEYRLQGARIVRPFWPGADYCSADYSGDCVVIDNPPFSILAEIKRFYTGAGIRFFIFAPSLTLFSGPCEGICHIVTDADITYSNGAKVNTSFATNLEDDTLIRTAPTLREAISVAMKKIRNEQKKELPKYRYPGTVTSAALLNKIANVSIRFSRHECKFIRKLDAQTAAGKTIFGGGYLISEGKAAEIRAAEIRAAEIRAAEIRASRECKEWELSAREKAIVDSLGRG